MCMNHNTIFDMHIIFNWYNINSIQVNLISSIKLKPIDSQDSYQSNIGLSSMIKHDNGHSYSCHPFLPYLGFAKNVYQ